MEAGIMFAKPQVSTSEFTKMKLRYTFNALDFLGWKQNFDSYKFLNNI